jgi:dihydrofolate reductase
MSKVTCDLSISVDGFVAGPNQTSENPIGDGGMRLHEWHFDPEGEDRAVVDAWMQSPGAYIMGRNMFGPDRGDWDLDWKGWWGDDPPYRAPVFVLGHQPREPLPMAGGTTFHFVADGIESALVRARAAAGEKPVAIAGGASTVNQYLAAGLVDELHLHVAPVVLGAGERLFDGVSQQELTPIGVIASPGVTHLRYRLG